MAEIVPPGDGFEKMIMGISNSLAKAEGGVMNVVYGGNDPLGGVKFPGNKAKTRGLIPILREINKIDLCNVINYLAGNISLLQGNVGEKVKQLHEAAKQLNDTLDLDFIDPTKAKNPEKIASLILYIVQIDELIDNEIVSVFPKIQDYKTNLSSLATFLIQYQAAAKSYGILSNSVNESLKQMPSGSSIDKATSNSNVIITVKSDEIEGVPVYTDLEVPVSLINELGKTIDNRNRIVFQRIDLDQIPIAEVQKLMQTIRDAKAVLQAIMSITSVNDLTSLLIPKEIQELQKIVDPAKLVPILRTILNFSRGLNQIAEQVLNYASVAKTIIKVITVIIKVVQIAIQIFRLLPLPLMFATAGVMDGLVWARQLLDGQLEAALRRVSQLGKLIDIIYAFASNIAGIIQEVITQIEILIYNLEVCSPSPIVAELKNIKGRLQDSLDNLKSLVDNYEKAKLASNETIYNGYIFKIEEEQVEDASITSYRRRAVAYDSSNIMVLATDLTFATDKTLLFEELRLKLVNKKLISDTGNKFDRTFDVLNALDLPESTDDIYASLGYPNLNGVNPQELMKSEMSEVQKQLNTVISNIKGGDDLKKLSQKQTLANNETLKTNIKEGNINLTSDPNITTTQGGSATVVNQVTKNPDILSDEEVKRLQNLIYTIENSPNAKGLVQTRQYQLAKEKLKRNADARRAAGM